MSGEYKTALYSVPLCIFCFSFRTHRHCRRRRHRLQWSHIFILTVTVVFKIKMFDYFISLVVAESNFVPWVQRDGDPRQQPAKRRQIWVNAVLVLCLNRCIVIIYCTLTHTAHNTERERERENDNFGLLIILHTPVGLVIVGSMSVMRIFGLFN